MKKYEIGGESMESKKAPNKELLDTLNTNQSFSFSENGLTNKEVTHESRKITIHINLDSLLDTWSIYRKNVVPISREEEDFIKETIIFKTSTTF